MLIPARKNPLKSSEIDLASDVHRLSMCRLASADEPGIDVDDLEMHRPSPSYTIDTVRALASRGWGRVAWLIGADALPDLPRWREPEALARECDLLIMARPGYALDFDSLPPALRRLRGNVVTAPAIDISASDIRRRLRAGESIRGLTPPAVERYIHEHRLYR